MPRVSVALVNPFLHSAALNALWLLGVPVLLWPDPKILLLNIELELKSEKENAEIRLDDPAKYQSIVDAEWNIIYDKLAKCAESGAQIVLSRLAIGDLGTQYFADRGIFCAGRVPEDDLQRVAKAAGEQGLQCCCRCRPYSCGLHAHCCPGWAVRHTVLHWLGVLWALQLQLRQCSCTCGP